MKKQKFLLKILFIKAQKGEKNCQNVLFINLHNSKEIVFFHGLEQSLYFRVISTNVH